MEFKIVVETVSPDYKCYIAYCNECDSTLYKVYGEEGCYTNIAEAIMYILSSHKCSSVIITEEQWDEYINV